MRIEKMISVMLTEDEVKEAIRVWLSKGSLDKIGILGLLDRNCWTVDTNNGEFVLCIDGIAETEEF